MRAAALTFANAADQLQAPCSSGINKCLSSPNQTIYTNEILTSQCVYIIFYLQMMYAAAEGTTKVKKSDKQPDKACFGRDTSLCRATLL
jgi:hypothetical protein